MSEGQIKYREAIELLNWRTKPAAMVQYQQAPLQVLTTNQLVLKV